MIIDTEVVQEFRARVTLDPDETPPTPADGVMYSIKPKRLLAVWIKDNGDRWYLHKIALAGPRILKGDVLSPTMAGSRVWDGRHTGNHRTDPPAWVLSIVNEVKPNGWTLS